jgi:hypothetical protein
LQIALRTLPRRADLYFRGRRAVTPRFGVVGLLLRAPRSLPFYLFPSLFFLRTFLFSL